MMAQVNTKIEDLRFLPFKRPEFFEYWKLAKQNPWTVFELKFFSDKQDWINYMAEEEKNCFTRALTAFNVSEQLIGEYWSRLDEEFSNYPEIIMLVREYSAQESNHMYSYNYIEEVFDLETFTQFIKDKEAVEKVQNLIDLRKSDALTSLAVFSGGAEGCSLFAIFALLVMFCRNNKMNTFKDILGWSAVEEALHSKSGIELYHLKKELMAQSGELDTYDWVSHEEKVYEGFDAIMRCEEAFIRYVMPNNLAFVTQDDLFSYLHFLGNQKLRELGLLKESEWRYEIPNINKAREINRMMLTLIKGKSSSDFFNRKLTDSYTSTVTQDFTVIDYTKKRNLWKDYIAA